MAVPFHRLKVAGDILIAARGAGIHTFNAVDGAYIASWRVPQKVEAKAEEKEEKTEDKTEQTEANADNAPPSKRRRVEGEQTEETETTTTTRSTTEKKKKNKPQVHKDAAKAQASALRTADLPVISILEVTADGRHVVAIMGQDKTVRVLTNDAGHLTQISARVVPKRPCAVAFTADGRTILSGDKFGDVYALPLIEVPRTAEQQRAEAAAAQADQRAPVAAPLRLEATEFTVHTKGNRQALENQRRQKELSAAQQAKLQRDKDDTDGAYRLLLGHVSMLTAVITAHGIVKGTGAGTAAGAPRPLILTADRDEHIRVTRGIVGNAWGAGAQTHVIETFCLGHTSFVSKLCIAHDRPDRLISGGGDSELWVWDFWPEGRLLGKADLAVHVGAVQAQAQTAGADKDKARVALSGLYSFGTAAADPDAMSDGDSSSTGSTGSGAFVVAMCERVPALFFFRMEDTTLAHTQTLLLPAGQLPLDVVEARDRLYVAAVPADEAAPGTAEAPSTLLSVTKSASGVWTAAPASLSLPAPSTDSDATTASLDRAALRKLLLHSTESLRKDNEEDKEDKEEKTNETNEET